MEENNLTKFFNKYIKGTPYKATVEYNKTLICSIDDISVYISTLSLKHLFDKKPAEEFHFILDYLHLIVEWPDKIYENKSDKRGNLCFVKEIKNSEYICSVEKMSDKELQIVTAFRLRDNDYIKSYTLLWNRGNGKPHRHAIDSLGESIDAPQ